YMGVRDDDRRGKPLLEGASGDSTRTGSELVNLADADTRGTEIDLARIDTSRQPLPSEVLRLPRDRAEHLKRELGDGGFSRIDTLPDGFASILQRHALQPGDVVGNRYRLTEAIGGGAMGDVFVAENQAIGMRVAVKVLKPQLLANPEFRQRFQYEAQAVGAIEHPNVARFLDLVVGDPTFLVMEYVPGETLAATLKRERHMSIQRAIHIGVRLAWGLDAAHVAGVIHRDLKPANVILSADREAGEMPKLIDFGLAKIAAAAGSDKLTRTGQIIGTPSYMSPEQISGREVDARSDVYALACLIYEMIAGKPPFDGGDDVQTLYRQLHEPPEPLSQHAPDCPAALDRVLGRALAKSPPERYGSMQELVRALDPFSAPRRMAGARFGSSSVTEVSRPSLPPRAMTALWAAGAFALGALLTTGAWSWRAHHRVAPTGGALVMVASEPPGAQVSVDGNPTPLTTPTAIANLAAGAHVVRITTAGHAPVEQHVDLASDARQLVDVTLPPVSHVVRLDSVPSGALVYIDGVLQIGQTPLDLTVDDDFHYLRLEKAGFEMATRSLTPDDHAAQVTVLLAPEKQDRGTLMVDSDVGAPVWVDGGDSGFISPSTFGVPAGMHTVQLREGEVARSAPIKVRIKKGESTRVTLRGKTP
ncbi:MAG TPA: serine/threonine-protein kinase, partial [Polyangia bacterium]|nr:serine/threonine-protein kinase [Polyangia bacterium]